MHTTILSRRAAMDSAWICLPAGWLGQAIWQGRLSDLPSLALAAAQPLLLFLHGSSGLNEQTRQYQDWLAESLGLASIAPDSFAQAERPVYRSPAAVGEYEAVHDLRQQEIAAALACLKTLAWVDDEKIILAGSSEGGVAAARWPGREFAARIVYSWPCEDNYFVETANNGFGADCRLLNILSDHDPFFAADSAFNQGRNVDGDSRKALAGMRHARLARLPDAPHTLYNLPAARRLAADFLQPLL
ncbi:dienelactone hydrolase family protein [Chromobacterium sp. IIBBL 290-4]|uniref:dienelactone hydrolase family protein n=1 Tax=Chromobacterium sp. IIBBL 290-4 TaxID=2953890 RepID=UPI0020B82F12|nr:hypothetical protein [Chromobacterium sp. IIBBL 290-4]UTH74618.1 hypothetical protein NKT35_00430 [Chromobacterium sp. IIBBL 290-4]